MARGKFQQFGVGLLFSAVALGAQAQSIQNSNAKAAPMAAQAVPATSTMAELQQLIQNRGLNELRTTYNGNYGASLLFKSDDLTYYVALFQQKNFWRVVKTTSEPQAEQTYKIFVDQTAQLADVDIRRIKLDAERSVAQKQLSDSQARLTSLQNDLTVQRQQEEQVMARQEQARQEANSLATEKQATTEQLTSLERQIKSLEDQQVKIDGLAPATTTAPALAPTAKRGK